MTHEYFSDRELGKTELKSEDITVPVYNGIVSIFKKFEKHFSNEYPMICPDNNQPYGTDVDLLNSAIQAQIPKIETPIRAKSAGDDVDKYALLDLIEFCYSRIVDIAENDWHSFFKHYHIFYPRTENDKEQFRSEVNHIFARNGLVFYLDSEGMIKRQLPAQLDALLQNLNVRSKDQDLNELVNAAIENIRKPVEFDRRIALEKIWDAFERLKTFYDPNNKKASATTLVTNLAAGTDKFDELLNNEFITLTSIGNNFQIRHFEQGKIKVATMNQVDYLFYRMISLIDLCMDQINDEV